MKQNQLLFSLISMLALLASPQVGFSQAPAASPLSGADRLFPRKENAKPGKKRILPDLAMRKYIQPLETEQIESLNGHS